MGGLAVGSVDHRVVAYKVPTEWRSLSDGLRATPSVSSFKEGSRAGFLGGYGDFRCRVVGCRVCGG